MAKTRFSPNTKVVYFSDTEAKLAKNYKKYFEIIDREDAANSCLADLLGIEQFELLCALVENLCKPNAKKLAYFAEVPPNLSKL